MATHRYWRLNALHNAPPEEWAFNQLCEFYLRQSPGGTDEVPVASSASSQFNGGCSPDKSYDGNDATFWMQFFGDEGPGGCWIAYDYGANITPVEMYLKASTGDIVGRTVTDFTLQYSDTGLGGPWTDWKFTGFADPWTVDGQVQTQDLTIPTPFVDATKLAFTAVASSTAAFVDATKFAITSVITASPLVRVTKFGYTAVVLGHNAHPNISPWTCEIDGHELVIWQLQDETIVYDFLTERWYVWGSGESPLWNPQTGQNWNANIGNLIAGLGGERVSNVLCGDGSTSALYFLDPELDEDYSPLGVANVPFTRIITGQLIQRGKNYKPLYGVQVQASDGFTVEASNLTVTLQYSDDQGVTYNSFGDRTVVLGSFAPVLDWNSLGSYRAPGRLLRLVDYGALRRVDDWTTPDG